MLESHDRIYCDNGRTTRSPSWSKQAKRTTREVSVADWEMPVQSHGGRGRRGERGRPHDGPTVPYVSSNLRGEHHGAHGGALAVERAGHRDLRGVDAGSGPEPGTHGVRRPATVPVPPTVMSWTSTNAPVPFRPRRGCRAPSDAPTYGAPRVQPVPAPSCRSPEPQPTPAPTASVALSMKRPTAAPTMGRDGRAQTRGRGSHSSRPRFRRRDEPASMRPTAGRSAGAYADGRFRLPSRTRT